MYLSLPWIPFISLWLLNALRVSIVSSSGPDLHYDLALNKDNHALDSSIPVNLFIKYNLLWDFRLRTLDENYINNSTVQHDVGFYTLATGDV